MVGALYEASVRVPLLMSGPGIVRNRRIKNLVSLIDLCPTFLDMTGLPQRSGLLSTMIDVIATGSAIAKKSFASGAGRQRKDSM
jgi:arylsulfatase A-like enzyme